MYSECVFISIYLYLYVLSVVLFSSTWNTFKHFPRLISLAMTVHVRGQTKILHHINTSVLMYTLIDPPNRLLSVACTICITGGSRKCDSIGECKFLYATPTLACFSHWNLILATTSISTPSVEPPAYYIRATMIIKESTSHFLVIAPTH